MRHENSPQPKAQSLQIIFRILAVIAVGWQIYRYTTRGKRDAEFQQRMAENGEWIVESQKQQRIASGMALPEPDRSAALKIGSEFLRLLRAGDFAAAAGLVTASQKEKLNEAALKKFVEDHSALKTEGVCRVTMVLNYSNPFGSDSSSLPAGGDVSISGVPKLPRAALELVQVEKGDAAGDAPLGVMISVSNRMLTWEVGNCEVPTAVGK